MGGSLDFFPMLVSSAAGKGLTFNVRGPHYLLLVNTPGLGEGLGVSALATAQRAMETLFDLDACAPEVAPSWWGPST